MLRGLRVSWQGHTTEVSRDKSYTTWVTVWRGLNSTTCSWIGKGRDIKKSEKTCIAIRAGLILPFYVDDA